MRSDARTSPAPTTPRARRGRRPLPGATRWRGGFFLLCFFAITSLPPLLVFILRTQQGRERVIWSTGLMLACGLGAWLHGLFPIPPQQPLIVLGRSSDALRIFLSHATEAEIYPITAGLALGTFAVFRHREARQRTLILAAWSTIFGSLFGLWLVGAEVLTWKSRYLVSFWMALTILVTAGLQALPRPRMVTGFVVTVTVLLGAWRLAPLLPNVKNIGRVVPEPVTCFERAAQKAVLARCVATYWNAKPVTVMATTRPVVIQIRSDGVPDWWINTRRHDRDGLPVDCAILDQGEAAQFAARFGQPDSTESCGTTAVLVYSGANRDRMNASLQPLLHLDITRRR